MRELQRLPPWFRTRIAKGEQNIAVHRLMRQSGLHTVCESAACPNQTECWNSGTATFLILGNLCTRSCRFCNVPKGAPQAVDHDEPDRVARTVARLGLSYAVVTSVTRDDLPDGGAAIFQKTIRAIRYHSPSCSVEVLIPDFQGSEQALGAVLNASPDVLNHNIETVPSLYSRVRPQAVYERSLELLSRAKSRGYRTKSGLMVGLGETGEELLSALQDLRQAGCDMVTLGQYLQPRKSNLPVHRYYHPDEFRDLETAALHLGFEHAAAGPLVRSSYHAGEHSACLRS